MLILSIALIVQRIITPCCSHQFHADLIREAQRCITRPREPALLHAQLAWAGVRCDAYPARVDFYNAGTEWAGHHNAFCLIQRGFCEELPAYSNNNFLRYAALP